MKNNPKRKSIGVNRTSMVKTQEFSQVSEEGSRIISEINQSVDQQLNWQYFHESKGEIESIIIQLLPKYNEYRKVLYDSLKEICLEGNITNYDYGKLSKEPTQSQQLKPQNKQSIPLNDKINTIEKIISERRIKKYYKNKHQINFQDELDPQDDQKQIYKFYQETFFKPPNNPQPQQQQQYQTYQTYLSPPQRANTISAIHSPTAEIDNKILDLSNQYQVQIDQSFERMKQQSQQPKIRINYMKVKDPFVGLQQEHELSFDVKNQPYFINNTNRINTQSFGWQQDDRNEVNSQINFDSQKMKKFNKNSNKTEQKGQDQLSHADNIYKHFIDKQHQELSKQKLRVQELTKKTEKVLNNEIEFDQPKTQQAAQEEDRISQLRYLLGEIIEIFSVEESLKFTLKFKSFELLKQLYQHASIYYNEEIVLQQPLQLKHLSQIIKAALPQQDEQGISIIVNNIYGNSSQISFQEFLQKLTPSINSKQYESLQSSNYTTTSSKTLDLTIRLFNLWIEMEYFQKQIKTMLQNHSETADRFIEETTQNTVLLAHLIAEFITKNKKFPKSKKLKCEIFFRKILGGKLTVSQFYRWADSKPSKLNQTLQKMQAQKYDQYYHLY